MSAAASCIIIDDPNRNRALIVIALHPPRACKKYDQEQDQDYDDERNPATERYR